MINRIKPISGSQSHLNGLYYIINAFAPLLQSKQSSLANYQEKNKFELKSACT